MTTKASWLIRRTGSRLAPVLPSTQGSPAKCADYFAAGCKVVRDRDLLSTDVVRVYRADAPDNSMVYKRGETADAEPAVPGWKMPVDDLFELNRTGTIVQMQQTGEHMR